MHFKGLDLNLLVILDVLLEEQNVTRAASRLHLSQPAVSAALAKLRQHTNDELLEKIGRGFRLTARAEQLIEPLKEILRQIESTIYTSSEFDQYMSDRTFTIAMSSYSAEVLMPSLIKRLSRSYPLLSCVVEEISEDSLMRVKTGAIDCCVTFQQPRLLNMSDPMEDLTYQSLFTDAWVLIASREKGGDIGHLSYPEFCQRPYVETRLGRNLPSFVERVLDHQTSRPKVSITMPSFRLSAESVMRSGCVAIVPELLIDDHRRPFLQVATAPFEIAEIEEFLVWHSRNDSDLGHIWFRSLISEVADSALKNETV